MHKLYCPSIVLISQFVSISVDIHELIRCHLHHVPIRRSLMRPDVLRIIVVLLGALKR